MFFQMAIMNQCNIYVVVFNFRYGNERSNREKEIESDSREER